MTQTASKLLSVSIGEQQFGLNVNCVNTILVRKESTHVPQAGERVAGLINLRGHIVMLVDVKTCLGLTGGDNARMNVTVDHGNEIYGLLFDSVGNLVDVDLQDMEPVPAVLDDRWRGMATGIFRQADSLLIMLDPARLIDKASQGGESA